MLSKLNELENKKTGLMNELKGSIFWRTELGLDMDRTLTIRKPVFTEQQTKDILWRYKMHTKNNARYLERTGKAQPELTPRHFGINDRIAAMPVYFLMEGEQVAEMPAFQFIIKSNSID